MEINAYERAESADKLPQDLQDRVDDLEDVLRDIVLGARMMMQLGSNEELVKFATEVKRVADAGLRP
jgi:hypothetical protein